MEYQQGNLLTLAKQGHFDYIAHGCNCFHAFGKGIARQIRDSYPEAYEADLLTLKGDASKLGTFSMIRYPEVTIINAYTQYRYGERGVMADYFAIEKVFLRIANLMEPSDRLGIPKIGAGLAGGDWTRIEAIIDKCLGGRAVTCVLYEN